MINVVVLLQNLEENIELTKVKIERAEKLISGLGGEKDRWTNVSRPLFAMVCHDLGTVVFNRTNCINVYFYIF